ncbi:glutathione S-transferase N-terminal domain-containing protein [Luminiphilus sp.]|nr:glutathione S-transferase N-terminal domain-containing protein [Luminiphilus sp.]MDA8828143.1 glutathione S-transferase N-terminal domain-containing protein [Luminiphilus sp.]MDA9580356.1 glutathione S-transferase N-terminal domain-containing protein [Luminiphilus sp.]MDA9847712.1 glutathione S-transferase N-terminal domain-containing protein [Luminiphilus sp.]
MLHYYPSPNSLKVIILLHELGLEWEGRYVDLAAGEQLTPAFAAMNPNRKVPVLESSAGDLLFESGAILEFLAERYRGFLGANEAERWQCKQWLYWQMSALGPAAGQAHHFRQFAPEQVPYGIRRYTDESNRLYGVLNERLSQVPWLGGSYSVADMAVWPWLVHADWQGQNVDDFPALAVWYKAMQSRTAVAEAWASYPTREIARQDYDILLNQRADTLKPA